jgi:Tfp pilus assembly ATPase PilU
LRGAAPKALTAKKEGMTPLDQEPGSLVREDVIEADEAWKKSVDKGDLVRVFESLGIRFTPPEN